MKQLNDKSLLTEISGLSDKLQKYIKDNENTNFQQELEQLKTVAEKVGESWSQSWLGYHSYVYYQGFRRPPREAVFDSQYGLKGIDQYSFISNTKGDWVEYNYQDVTKYIVSQSNSNFDKLNAIWQDLQEHFVNGKAEALSLFAIYLKDNEDKFVASLEKRIDELRIYSREEIAKSMMPTGTFMSSDVRAMTGRIAIPPHLAMIAMVEAFNSPLAVCKILLQTLIQFASHVSKIAPQSTNEGTGTKVFIGHGQSKLWRELKDFIQDRMYLQWDEFNRVPIAGITNITRLSEMLDNAAIAFLILTAEDEQSNGRINPRMNVIHEAGLFQGRLGFEKAIILLEEGCEEFSNINGLGQIRFPAGNIKAAFEEVREVLEREGLVNEK